MYAWKREVRRDVYALDVADEIIFKKHECEWILPYNMAGHIKYNPRHLPVIDILPNIKEDSVALWAVGVDYSFMRVFAAGRPNEDYYLAMSIDRIKRGHRAFTPAVLPQVPFVVAPPSGRK